jgi:hypothetical protein
MAKRAQGGSSHETGAATTAAGEAAARFVTNVDHVSDYRSPHWICPEEKSRKKDKTDETREGRTNSG